MVLTDLDYRGILNSKHVYLIIYAKVKIQINISQTEIQIIKPAHGKSYSTQGKVFNQIYAL